MRTWLDAVVAVALAPTCAACTQPLEHPTRGPVCSGCWSSILRLTAPLCEQCGDPLGGWQQGSDAGRCRQCLQTARLVARSRAIGVYDGALRSIVHALKYDARRSLARPLAAMMRAAGADILTGAAAAVPVPLHRSRLRSRGFNQADDLARHVGLAVLPALRRTRATRDQVELPAAERHRNVSGAFEATRAAAAVVGQVVVVVDDVSTTGATLEACARALKEAGVREVRALTAARVPAGPR